jgi:SAM-dependent MidA family methyltransferase
MMAALDDLPAPSSFLSSRWSRDSLLTGHPAQLYDGAIVRHIDEVALDLLIRDLETTTGPLHVGAGRMGVYTWDIACTAADGPFVLQVPLVLDAPGTRGRAKRDVPRHNVDNLRSFIARGLKRFAVAPIDVLTLAEGVPAARLAALPDHHPISFGYGSLHVELTDGALSWLVALGPVATADLLAEMIAALVYHYDPDAGGGTAITDVVINDGDFHVRRRNDGGFDVRLTAARRRESGIAPSLLLLYLIQMMAYEDWTIDGRLVGLPTLASNPSVTFAGVVRGVAYRCRDLGEPADAGVARARRWIHDFGRSREGRAYRPWVDRFLDGGLPLAFGGDPRERWWRLVHSRTKLGVLDLRARQDPTAAPPARVLRSFIDRLAREIGRAPENDGAATRINDLGRDDLLRLLEEAQVAAGSRGGVVDDLLARWPFRGLDHLVAQVPGARSLRRLKSRLVFGRVLAEDDQGTLAGLGPASGDGDASRPLANPEAFGGPSLPSSLHEAAVRTFPTFEAYMDAALHDARWGYYARRVSIGRGGHFITNPESLSPRYGGWIATCAFRLWRDMIAHGELSETDAFPIVEFGAGNGRLARDVVDAVAKQATVNMDDTWQTFAARLAYRIYETSPSLRDRQRALLGNAARVDVGAGDARRPGETLARDFPGGLRGLVLTNEVPDAFGVHKVALTPDGEARAALVVPRVEPALRDAVGADLARRIDDADASVRRTFGLRANAADLYLDGETWMAVMNAVAALSSDADEADARVGALWFEEAYVPAACVPELAAHLAANAAQYATALAAEDSGVVAYVNVHAGRFVRELGSSLAAGFVITIDYGDTTWGLVQGARRGDFPFRVYGDQQDFFPRPNDPYAAPGTQDMTADVNFTDLAAAGAEVGLRLVHFGPERDLCGDDLPALLAAAADGDPVAEFLGNPVFKVLVLGTRTANVIAGPLLSPLPLAAREQDVPKARRTRIAGIEKRLIAQALPDS